MALIKCPECGKQISDKAEMCPHCGINLKVEEILHGDSEKIKEDIEVTDVSSKDDLENNVINNTANGGIESKDTNTKVKNKSKNRSKICIGVLSTACVLSLIGNIVQFSEIQSLSQKNKTTVSENKQSDDSSQEANKVNASNTSKQGESTVSNTEEIGDEDIKEITIDDTMEVHTEYGDYSLKIDALRKSDWLSRSDPEDTDRSVILLEMDMKNTSYEDPYNTSLFIDNQIIAFDNNNYVVESWGSSYDDGSYERSPKLITGANYKLVVPYVVNNECDSMTFVFNNEYKITLPISQ